MRFVDAWFTNSNVETSFLLSLLSSSLLSLGSDCNRLLGYDSRSVEGLSAVNFSCLDGAVLDASSQEGSGH